MASCRFPLIVQASERKLCSNEEQIIEENLSHLESRSVKGAIACQKTDYKTMKMKTKTMGLTCLIGLAVWGGVRAQVQPVPQRKVINRIGSPGYTNVAPAYRNVAPGYTNIAPGYTNVAPAYTNVAPAYRNFAPGYTNVAPAYRNAAPGYTNIAPSYRNVAPAYTNVAPTYKNFAPGYTNVAPNITNPSLPNGLNRGPSKKPLPAK